MSSVNGASMASSQIGMDYAVSVANKSKAFVKQQGQTALQLIDSATKVSNTSGANGVSNGTSGRSVDVVA